MSAQEIDTLINLLEDPDKIVFGAVASRFLKQGKSSIPYLEKIWEDNKNEKVRERIETIIQQIRLQATQKGLQEWIAGPDHNLLEGAYWVAKQSYPELHFSQLRQAIDDVLKDIWVGISDEYLTVYNKLNIFNLIFYHTHSYASIDGKQLLNPTYCFINRVLETKCGNAVTLGLLYLHIAQQIGMPLYGACMPDSFFLACMDTDGKVRCYIDPFDKGKYAERETFTAYMLGRGVRLGPPDGYAPCDNVLVILRLVEYLVFASVRDNNPAQAAVYRSLLPLFGNRTTHFLYAEDEGGV
jgi:hypothetical protein